ncbi:hypothetical protein SAY86_002778 [Trapa natans]|uniref:Agenet domain-containing protein n=1 Tax=Trapa natans TaxID=22666 RepID=A0AAN7LKS9_TRANT|nr:hypothetical protein SAY86_002778 [Trapa natans]
MAHQWFREGADVEIASLLECLEGVLFSGKVVAPSFDDANKFVIEYETLTTQEDGISQPLMEDVSVGLLRPRPPTEAKLVFKSDEIVDAFFNGGWWNGVVVTPLNNSCYLVWLRRMGRNYQFRASELRVHREWKMGAWFPPFDQLVKLEEDDVNAEMLPVRLGEVRVGQELMKRALLPEFIGRGALVEVRSDEDGFQGSWYGATIIERISRDKFIVEYLSLRTDDDKKYLREEVDSFHIRPHPLDTLVVDAYKKNARVDVFYNDGWWEGRIVKVLHGSRYRIYFWGTRDEMVLHHLDLRPHQDWVDGKWVHDFDVNSSRKTKKRIRFMDQP